ncbi:oxidoreductase [Actinomycetota bacterium]|nr:oxidoreductase [Actinomycetota bacterium]
MSRNGILVDYHYCSGCYSCEVACQSELDLPLNQWGVKVLQNGPWPIRDKVTGENTERFNYDFIPAFTEICDLCEERVAKGKEPSCVHHCQADILRFGPVEELVKQLDEKPWQFLWVPPKG